MAAVGPEPGEERCRTWVGSLAAAAACRTGRARRTVPMVARLAVSWSCCGVVRLPQAGPWRAVPGTRMPPPAVPSGAAGTTCPWPGVTVAVALPPLPWPGAGSAVAAQAGASVRQGGTRARLAVEPPLLRRGTTSSAVHRRMAGIRRASHRPLRRLARDAGRSPAGVAGVARSRGSCGTGYRTSAAAAHQWLGGLAPTEERECVA